MLKRLLRRLPSRVVRNPYKVSILLKDGTWLEGISRSENMVAINLKDVARSRQGESGSIPVGKKVCVPWSSILFIVMDE